MSYLSPWTSSNFGGGNYPPHHVLPFRHPPPPTTHTSHETPPSHTSHLPVSTPLSQGAYPITTQTSHVEHKIYEPYQNLGKPGRYEQTHTPSPHNKLQQNKASGDSLTSRSSESVSESSGEITSLKKLYETQEYQSSLKKSHIISDRNEAGVSTEPRPRQSSEVQRLHSQSETTTAKAREHPSMILGLPSPSSFDLKAHRKTPIKYPPPEQLPAPVMFSYQARGRPRKNWTHASGLPFKMPVTHPPIPKMPSGDTPGKAVYVSSPKKPITPSEDTDQEVEVLGLPSMMSNRHPSNNQEGDENGEDKLFKCTLCDKGFKLKAGLQQHERTHSTDRPYICPECGKLFRQPTHLQQHMRIHTGEKPYDCPFCDKSFRQRTILNQHLRIHTGEKPYICMECGKQFRQKAILDQHYRTHLGDKPFACPHPSCRKHFREMATLISHMRSHKDVPDSRINLQQSTRKAEDEGGYDVDTIKRLTRINDQGQCHEVGDNTNKEEDLLRIKEKKVCGSSTSDSEQSQNSGDIGSDRCNFRHTQEKTSNIDQEISRTTVMSYNSNRESIEQQQNSYESVIHSHMNSERCNEETPSQKTNEMTIQHSLDKSNETQRSTMATFNTPQSSMTNQSLHSHAQMQGSHMSAMSPLGTQMYVGNFFPYPHSIFPATSYMMPHGTSDHRQYSHSTHPNFQLAPQSHTH